MGGTIGTAVSSTHISEMRAILREAAAGVWTDEELQQAYDDAIRYFSTFHPREVHDTSSFTTTADSRLIDISSLTTLLYGFDNNSIVSVEYEIDNYPREYRNWNIIGTDLEIDVKSKPSNSTDEVYIVYKTYWTEDNLPMAYASLVQRLASAFALKNTPRKFLNDLMDESNTFDNITTAIGNMSAQITLGIADLASGRTLLTSGAGEDVVDALERAITDIDSARGFFNKSNVGSPETEYLNSAATELRTLSAHISNAGGFGSLNSGELNAANTYVRQADIYLKHFNARLQKIASADKYRKEGLEERSLLQPELNACTKVYPDRVWAKD